jgi:dUTPase
MKLLTPIFTIVILNSCMQHHYIAIGTTNQQAVQTKQQIAVADSAIGVTYVFDGLYKKMGLTLTNKSNNAIMVDWRKSAIIINGKSNSIYNSIAPFSSTSVAAQTLIQPALQTSGVTAIPEANQFIPPASTITKYDVVMWFDASSYITPTEKKLVKTGLNNTNQKFTGKQFTNAESPLQMRIYITYTSKSDIEKVIETSFYATEIMLSRYRPTEIVSIYYNNQPVLVH